MTKRCYTLFSTSMGWVGILASGQGIRRLALPQASFEMVLSTLELDKDEGEPVLAPEALEDIRRRLERYFEGEEVRFPDALDLAGTLFQKTAWEAARTIPYGEIRSYRWIACQMGRPRAVRAVGQAMRANPVPIIVPCHRVIGAHGNLCGYGGPGGVELKQKLLDMERENRDR